MDISTHTHTHTHTHTYTQKITRFTDKIKIKNENQCRNVCCFCLNNVINVLQETFHLCTLFFLVHRFFFFFFSKNSTSRTVKLSSTLFSSTATCSSSFESRHVHGSAFSHQTKHLWMLVSILNYNFAVSSPISRNLLVELRYALYNIYTCIYSPKN